MASESSESKKAVETWNGSCHCGKVKFTVNLQSSLYDQPTTMCNCSICQRNGHLFVYPGENDITWHCGKETLKRYTFASHRIGHRFCPECGTNICAYSDVPGFLEGYVALNVRALEDVDIDKLKLKKTDGRSLRDIGDIDYGAEGES